MKAIVVYDSWVGRTEILARKIAEGLGSEAFMAGTFDYEALLHYDLVVLGSPTHFFYPTRRIVDILERVPFKYAAFFTTYSTLGGARTLRVMRLMSRANRIVGVFCKHADIEGQISAFEFGVKLKRTLKELLKDDFSEEKEIKILDS